MLPITYVLTSPGRNGEKNMANCQERGEVDKGKWERGDDDDDDDDDDTSFGRGILAARSRAIGGRRRNKH